ncbi:RICIN domain-containing protein [Desulfovibrio desulfuricans]|uniref:RICIN domain-containing protein n=1 Tax=Desulfovibrio desulfuricans TaxID=876 RepID=UPI0039841740
MKNTQKVMKKNSGIAACSRLAILLAACLILPQVALAAVIADGDYLIQMADSDLAVVSSGMTVRERVTLGQNEQAGIWRFEHLGNDFYKIIAPKLAMVLDSSESKKYNGVPTIIFPWHGGRNQRWKVIEKGEFYELINQETGLALDLKGNVQRVGTVFQGYAENASRGQLFRLTPMGKQSPSAKVRDDQEKEPLVKSFSNGPAGQ